jgi:metal-sulfur cluster biosynthetic enzyme
VRAALAAVSDPELDQSVVDLDFIARIEVTGSDVAVDFRLPTFWCSANFAWIMAEDMREAVAGLGWPTGVSVRLVDHFAAERINAGVARHEAFGAVFDSEADAQLVALREKFREKAFLGRMSAAIDALRRNGWSGEALLALTIADLAAIAEAGPAVPAGDDADEGPDLPTAITRYLALRRFYGGGVTPADAAFRTVQGEAIAPAALPTFLRDIRMTRRGAEANGEMCKALLRARLGASPELHPGEGGR